MRHFMVDPDNEERLLKIPYRTVQSIRADAIREAIAAVEAAPLAVNGSVTRSHDLTALRALLPEGSEE